jgi:hypothetical protein
MESFEPCQRSLLRIFPKINEEIPLPEENERKSEQLLVNDALHAPIGASRSPAKNRQAGMPIGLAIGTRIATKALLHILSI